MAIDFAKARDIFNVAVHKPESADKRSYLDAACGADTELRQHVDRLLGAHEQSASFLDQGAVATLSPDCSLCEAVGTNIGPYKLIQQIGEGGFGVVFLAEQATPIRRRVALKIVKPGMDTRQVIARFEAERQALALMDHHGIAKVFDAGVTEQGRSYFVMELVAGVPINEYCDECNLTTRERLSLFIAVCQAVQHAHQKGIVHRDLKPTNVLVAMQDGRPAPKIIDFGVAKAIEQRLTEHTLTTGFAQMIGTPMYMSPEQAELSPLGVDTRTDIYAMGVLLYELLSGTTPFDQNELHAASFDELRRIIREQEPPRPSTRFTTLAADQATTIAAHRRSDVQRLVQSIRGELDWIVMKCLEKDRNRRYDSAGSLVRDVECYLHDEPVQACPPSRGYRLKKFVRRNKTAAAFIALLLLSVAGLSIANLALKRERDEKAAALADASSVSYLLQEMLSSSYPDQVKDSHYTVRQLLDEFSVKMSDYLENQPEVEAAMRSAIGLSYWRLRVLDSAERDQKIALDLRRQEFGDDDERVADSLRPFANTLADQGRFAEAETCAQEAISIYQKYGSAPRLAGSEADALFMLALLRLRQGDRAGYRAICNVLVELPVHTEYVVANAYAVWPLCLAPDALDDMNRLVTRAERFVAENSLTHGHYGSFMLGAALFRARRYREAAEHLEQSIAAYPSLPPHGFDTFNYQQMLLAMTKWRQGRKDEARRLFAESRLVVDKEILAPTTLWGRRTILELLRDEAEALIRPDPTNAPNTGTSTQGTP